MSNKSGIFSVIVAAMLFVGASQAISADVSSAKNKLVMQVSDDDPVKWNLALNNANNVQAKLGKDNVDIEIVAYGAGGIKMLKADSVVGSRLIDAKENGVKIVACEVTMKGAKLTKADMHPSVGYVPTGAVELMQKQLAGYAYIRP